MDSHQHARLTACGRSLLSHRAPEQGCKVQAASAFVAYWLSLKLF